MGSKYPCLKENLQYGAVALFISQGKGVLLHQGSSWASVGNDVSEEAFSKILSKVNLDKKSSVDERDVVFLKGCDFDTSYGYWTDDVEKYKKERPFMYEYIMNFNKGETTMTVTAKDINGNEIKVGDTVERVVYSASPHCEVKVGETYLVENISDVSSNPYLKFEDIRGSYYANKFKVIPSKKQPFTKSDLKDGMIVTYRKGWKRVIFKGTLYDLTGADLTPSACIEYYYDTLQHDKHNDMDIVKVTYMDEVLWEREEPLTKEQLRIKELEEGIAKMQEELNKLVEGK